MSKKPVVAMESTGTDIFVVVDGVRIAKRGSPGARHAGTWFSLEPGYTVYSDSDHITVELNGVRVH